MDHYNFSEKLNKNRKVYYFILFTILLLFMFFISEQKDATSRYIASIYARDYSFGFVSRGIISELYSLIFDTINYDGIFIFTSFFIIILILLTSILMVKLTLSANKENILAIYFLGLFFCINPMSVSTLFSSGEFGRYDLFIYLFAFLSVFAILKNNNTIYLVPIYIILMNLVHHANATLQIAPVILVMMLYFGIKEKDKRMIIIMFISFIITSVFFLFFTFHNPLSAYSNEFLMKSFQSNSEFPLSEMAVLSDNYPLSQHIFYVKSQFWYLLLPRSSVMIVTFIPIIVLMIYILKECLKNSKGKEKLLYALIPLNLLSRIPLFIIVCDYGRMMTYISITQMLILFTFII